MCGGACLKVTVTGEMVLELDERRLGDWVSGNLRTKVALVLLAGRECFRCCCCL